MRLSFGVRIFVLSLGFTSAVFAQNFVGGVRGIITNHGGAVISSAIVSLVNTATGTTRSSTSNSSGEYVFSQAEPATYSITVEAPGFKKLTRTGVVIATQELGGGMHEVKSKL